MISKFGLDCRRSGALSTSYLTYAHDPEREQRKPQYILPSLLLGGGAVLHICSNCLRFLAARSAAASSRPVRVMPPLMVHSPSCPRTPQALSRPAPLGS